FRAGYRGQGHRESDRANLVRRADAATPRTRRSALRSGGEDHRFGHRKRARKRPAHAGHGRRGEHHRSRHGDRRGCLATTSTSTGYGVSMEYRNFIGNAWKAADNGESLDVVDPSTGEPFASIARGNAGDIDIAV